MVKYFKEALGKAGKVHVSNSDDKTVAFRYADKAIVTPLIYDNSYIPFLKEYCIENHIDVLLSLFDIDLLVLSQHKKEFEDIGTRVIISDPELISICNDKWKTYLFLKENGFNVPRTYLSLVEVLHAVDRGDICYPIIVKPRFGCGSIAVSIAEDEMDLLFYFRKNTRLIHSSYLKYESCQVNESEQIVYQEFLVGQEYGADIINDLNGEIQNVIIKKKLAMRAGETDIAEIVCEPNIEKELTKLGQLTKHVCNMDIDVFLSGNKPFILELNARFGGGYPFSHMAGCNIPKAIIQWIRGEKVDKEVLSAKVGLRGYKELVITKQ